MSEQGFRSQNSMSCSQYSLSSALAGVTDRSERWGRRRSMSFGSSSSWMSIGGRREGKKQDSSRCPPRVAPLLGAQVPPARRASKRPRKRRLSPKGESSARACGKLRLSRARREEGVEKSLGESVKPNSGGKNLTFLFSLDGDVRRRLFTSFFARNATLP